MSSPLRWGVLGASGFALSTMIPAIHAARNNVLFGIATSDPKKAVPASSIVADLEVYEAYSDLLSDDRIDAVYIPLPNHMHAEWAEKAMSVGKHVLCEKPIGMDANQIRALIKTQKQMDVFCAEALMIAHHAQWRRVRDEIAKIGALQRVAGHFSFLMNNRDNIRLRKGGGGVLRDIGIYPISAVKLVTGLTPEVQSVRTVIDLNGVDLTARVQCQLPGISFDFCCSFEMGDFQEMKFFGRDGVIIVSAPFNTGVYAEGRVEVRRQGEADRVLRFPVENHYINEVERFSEVAQNQKIRSQFPWSLEDSLFCQTVLDQIIEHSRA